MIKITRPTGPKQLLMPLADDVARERSEAETFFTAAVRSKKAFEFKIYKKEYIKDALQLVFYNKCAYCETSYIANSPVDIEHFRPKSLVTVGKQKKPGYYWLASEWSNLLPSCNLCNRSQTYLMPNKKKETMGKMNNFPLVDETLRATKRGEEQHETPVLLNPIDDNPAEHLEFRNDGAVWAIEDQNGQPSHRGEVSIKVYGLCRPPLVDRRKERADAILAQIERVKRATENIQQYPNDPKFKDDLRRELADLNAHLDPKKEYLALARQLTDSFFKSIASSITTNP